MKHSERFTALFAALSAVSTMICCLPLGIAAAAGAAGFGVVLQPLRPWLLTLSAALLVIGFVQLARSGRVCRQRSSVSILVLLVSAMIVGGIILFPQAVAGILADLIS